MTSLAFWLRLHGLGWPVWVPTTIALAVAMTWGTNPGRRHALPWLLLTILLAGMIVEDLRTGWHEVYWQDRRVWGAGMLAALVVSLVPVFACLIGRPLATRLLTRRVLRTLSLVAFALLLRLILGAYLYHGIQRGLLD